MNLEDFNNKEISRDNADQYRLQKMYAPKTAPGEANFIDVEKMEASEDIANEFDSVFDKKTFKNKEADAVREKIDAKVNFTQKLENEPTLLIEKINSFKKDLHSYKRKIVEANKLLSWGIDDPIKKLTLENDIVGYAAKIDNLEKAIREFKTQLPAGMIPEDDETTMYEGFSKN